MQVCDGKQEFNSEFLENIISPDGQSAPVRHHGILQCREKKPGAVPTMMKCRNRRERFDLYTLIQGCVLCYVCVCVCECSSAAEGPRGKPIPQAVYLHQSCLLDP